MLDFARPAEAIGATTSTLEKTEHTVADHGRLRLVDPNTVIEVVFDAIQRSNRHGSGFALRFPRIVRLRDDKPPSKIDTLSRVRELHERYFARATPPAAETG
jgi:DNA ligase-1